jgi:DNA-binding MarR family transcriptional regulator
MADLTQRDYERLHEFRYSIRRFLHFSEEAARTAGLDPQQHQLLLTVQACGPVEGVIISRIAERLQIRHHTAVELVDRAAERGLVTRHRSQTDQRLVTVTVTDTGKRLLQELSTEHLLELRSAGPELARLLLEIVNEPGSSSPTQ